MNEDTEFVFMLIFCFALGFFLAAIGIAGDNSTLEIETVDSNQSTTKLVELADQQSWDRLKYQCQQHEECMVRGTPEVADADHSIQLGER